MVEVDFFALVADFVGLEAVLLVDLAVFVDVFATFLGAFSPSASISFMHSSSVSEAASPWRSLGMR